jgi:hypothetical protein
MVWGCMAAGHARYLQNLASKQYQPVAEKLKLLHAVLIGTHGIKYEIRHEVGHCTEDNVLSMT